jgi:hypothetical protein
VYSIYVRTGVDASLEDAIAAVQGVGVTASNFQYLQWNVTFDDTTPAMRNVLDWYFSITAPLSAAKSTVTQLAALQQSAAKAGNGISITFTIQGLQVSPQLAQSQPCSLNGLLADARAQAAKLAASAGTSVGSVLAISGFTGATDTLSNPFASTASIPVCSVTVKFALGGF